MIMYKIIMNDKEMHGAKVICKCRTRMSELVDFSEALYYLDGIYDNLTYLERTGNTKIIYVSRVTDGVIETAFDDCERGNVKRTYKIVKQRKR